MRYAPLVFRVFNIVMVDALMSIFVHVPAATSLTSIHWLRGMQVLKCRDASLFAPIAVVQRIELNSAKLVASKVSA
jgi:hypothetical protein